MDYKKVYNQIIQNRLENPLTDDEYVERHHIVPKSLGGTNEPNNLVKLTAREHFICHALLAEMYERDSFEWYKMNLAFMMMKAVSHSHNGNRYSNSKLYELKKKDFSIVMSYSQSDKKNSQYGKVWIYNLHLEKSIRVYKSELVDYLNSGWIKGRVLDFGSYKVAKLNKKISKEQALKNYNIQKDKYVQLFNLFLESDCKSLNEFHKHIDYPHSLAALCNQFRRYVDNYNPIARKSYKL